MSFLKKWWETNFRRRYTLDLSCLNTEASWAAEKQKTSSVDFVSTDITTEISPNLLVQTNRIVRTAVRKRALIKKAANDKENTKAKTQKLNKVQSEKANYKPKDEAENRNNMRKEQRQEAGTGRTRTQGRNRTEQNRTEQTNWQRAHRLCTQGW